MAHQKITKRVIDGLRPADAEFTLWDADLTGFGVRVRPSGVASYIVVYRAGAGRNSPVKKLKIGSVGRITPEQARLLARKALGDVAHGRDPAVERAKDRQGINVRQLAEIFLGEHVGPKRKETTAEHYRHAIRAYIVAEFGATRADCLQRDAVAKMHLRLRSKPAMANYVVAVLKSMYGFAQKRGLVPDGYNPASKIEKYREERRERYLNSEEIGRLGDALREAETSGIPWSREPDRVTSKHTVKPPNQRTLFSPYAVAAVRLLLLTGCRLREVLHLKWEFVDFERGMLFLPDSKTGRKAVVLNAFALAVLSELPKVGQYVIAADSSEKPRHDLKRIWACTSKRANITGVRIHDLRHTFASVGAGGGLGLPIVGKLLGHSQASTTARYAHLDTDPLRRASDQIGRTIFAALEQK